MTHIGIIGGGASGLMAAIIAGQHAKVTILEHTNRVGKKILSTGNGKCNFTNLNISKDDYYGNHPSFVDSALSRFGAQDMVDFLNREGVLTIEKRDGYMYPYSGQASTILEFFLRKIKEQKIDVVFHIELTSVYKQDKHFVVETKDKHFHFDKLIFATGGKAAPVTGSDGSGFTYLKEFQLHMIRQYPVLTSLHVSDPEIRALTGVRTNGKATLKIDGEIILSDQGEIQFTTDCVSGIPVFQLCHDATRAFAQKKEVKVWIDFLPQMDIGESKEYLLHLINANQKVSICELLSGMVHKKIAYAIMERLKLSEMTPACEVSEKQLKKINSCLHQFVFTMDKQADFTKAQATSGGVSIDEMDENMMVKKVPGLYIIGEMLDIDGKCGGYNLQWAWTSGYIAGLHAAGK